MVTLVIDPTPELTPDEIEKIKKNLDVLMDMNEKVYGENTSIISEVWGMLNGQQDKDSSPDVGKSSYKTILVSALAIGGIVLEQPELEIAAVILGGVFEYLSENDTSNKITHVNLDAEFGLLSNRNTSSYNAINIILGQMFDDPNKFRDQSWTVNVPYTCFNTLRDLINITIPGKDTEQFQLTVQAQCRQYRHQITIPAMEKMQYWDIYFVQDLNYKGSNFGMCYVPGPPGQPNPPGGIERTRELHDMVEGMRIFANDEIWHFHPDYKHVESFLKEDELKKSYLGAVADFVNKFPAAYIYPYSITNKYVKSWRYYIMEGYNKITDPSSNFGVANGDFLKWLFIDDGAGNVVNPDGVGYRYDIICSENIMRNRHMIPFQTNTYGETVYLQSSDLAYPKVITKYNIRPKIYIKDLKRKNTHVL